MKKITSLKIGHHSKKIITLPSSDLPTKTEQLPVPGHRHHHYQKPKIREMAQNVIAYNCKQNMFTKLIYQYKHIQFTEDHLKSNTKKIKANHSKKIEQLTLILPICLYSTNYSVSH